MKKINIQLTLCSVLLFVILIGASAFTTNNSDLNEFRIQFERTNIGLKLIGQKGTAFNELSFTLTDNVQRIIDEFGMTTSETKEDTNDDSLVDFEFTIEKIGNEYILISKKGTAWTRLSFVLSQGNKAIVNQDGVIVK